MKFALYPFPIGELADVRLLGGLAHEAEEAGYDGFFIWDSLVPSVWPDGEPVADTQVALTAIALATTRIAFGAMVTPLPRRRPVKFASEALTLDRASGGRLIVAAGSGGEPSKEFANLGDPEDPRERGDLLDESLAIVDPLLRGETADVRGRRLTAVSTRLDGPRVQQPRPPIWLGASPTGWRALRRSARFDGVFLLPHDFSLMSPEVVRDAVAYIAEHRSSDGPFDVAMTPSFPDNSPRPTPGVLTEYAEAGVTWWVEYAYGLPAARELIRRGRPSV